MDAPTKQAATAFVNQLVTAGSTPNVTIVIGKEAPRDGYIETAGPPFVVVSHTASEADLDLDLDALTKITVYDDADVAHVFPDTLKRMEHCLECKTEGRKASTWHIEQWRKLDGDLYQCPKGHKLPLANVTGS